MHAYPSQLANFVLDHWPAGTPLRVDRRQLMEVLSICYQASLTHEEGRPVRFRLVSASAKQIEALGRVDQFLPLELKEPIPLSPDGLRRLSPAAPFHSSLIGAGPGADGPLIWGVVHTGAEWLAPTWGGRDRHVNIESPTVHVLGPGRLSVYAANDLVATLGRGVIEGTTTDVFTSNWLGELFRGSRKVMGGGAPEVLRLANDTLVRTISQRMVRRAIFLVRQAGHGGLILFAEPDLLDACSASASGPLKLKYSFAKGEARERYRRLLTNLVEVLAVDEAGAGVIAEGGIPSSVQRFLNNETPETLKIEQAIFEVSRLVSNLAAVDGAVVLNKRFDLMGFGAEVSGELPYPDTVWQALDVEAERRVPEAANSVGTRHRAAYRFVTAHPKGLAIVISHDGFVRFVANLEGKVIYWDQFLNW
jgi:hypothetical protein